MTNLCSALAWVLVRSIRSITLVCAQKLNKNNNKTHWQQLLNVLQGPQDDTTDSTCPRTLTAYSEVKNRSVTHKSRWLWQRSFSVTTQTENTQHSHQWHQPKFNKDWPRYSSPCTRIRASIATLKLGQKSPQNLLFVRPSYSSVPIGKWVRPRHECLGKIVLPTANRRRLRYELRCWISEPNRAALARRGNQPADDRNEKKKEQKLDPTTVCCTGTKQNCPPHSCNFRSLSRTNDKIPRYLLQERSQATSNKAPRGSQQKDLHSLKQFAFSCLIVGCTGEAKAGEE